MRRACSNEPSRQRDRLGRVGDCLICKKIRRLRAPINTIVCGRRLKPLANCCLMPVETFTNKERVL